MLKNYYYKCDCGSEIFNIEVETDRISDENIIVVYLNIEFQKIVANSSSRMNAEAFFAKFL